TGIDSTVNPAENFFLYANGTWLENTEIPPSKTGWGSFYIVRDQTLQQIKTIVDSVTALEDLEKGSIGQQVAALYKSAMDSVAIKKAGLKPLQESLGHIAAIESTQDVINEVARQYQQGSGTLFGFYVAPDDKNSRVQRAHFNQGGLGLPNRNYYFKDDSRSKKIRQAYQNYITTVLTLSGSDKSTASEE